MRRCLLKSCSRTYFKGRQNVLIKKFGGCYYRGRSCSYIASRVGSTKHLSFAYKINKMTDRFADRRRILHLAVSVDSGRDNVTGGCSFSRGKFPHPSYPLRSTLQSFTFAARQYCQSDFYRFPYSDNAGSVHGRGTRRARERAGRAGGLLDRRKPKADYTRLSYIPTLPVSSGRPKTRPPPSSLWTTPNTMENGLENACIPNQSDDDTCKSI